MLIPDKLISFNAFGGDGGTRLLGIVDAELPKFENITDTISGAGFAGEFDSPVTGHFKSQTLKLKWRVPTPLATSFLEPGFRAVTLRASAQIVDSAAGATATQAIRVDVRGPSKMTSPGKLESGKQMDAETEIEVAYIVITIAGVKVVELDKFNYIFRVNGVDHLAAVRADMGG